MKELVLTEIETKTKFRYSLKDIEKISFEKAKYIFGDDMDLKDADIKKKDILLIIDLKDKEVSMFKAKNWDMRFE